MNPVVAYPVQGDQVDRHVETAAGFVPPAEYVVRLHDRLSAAAFTPLLLPEGFQQAVVDYLHGVPLRIWSTISSGVVLG